MAGQLTIDILKASTGVLATQNGMTGIAKAWVYFDGSTTPPTIKSSFNVSSVVRNSTGNFTVSFTTAFADANYSQTGQSCPAYGTSWTTLQVNCADGSVTESAPTASSCRFSTGSQSGRWDVKYVYFQAFSA